MSNRRHLNPEPKPLDPFAAWRHLDGQVVTARTTKLLEDVDGAPLGVDVDESTGLLVLPQEQS